jgi:ribosomal protein S27E
MTLRALPTMHDLPPAWDGQPVTWGEWVRVWSTLDFHLPASEIACRACGLIESSLVATGAVDRILVLYAFRCPGCRHDVVFDRRTDESWDLEPVDYLDGGSTSGGLW